MNQSGIRGSLGHKSIKGFQNKSEGPLWTLTNRRLKKIMIMKPILKVIVKPQISIIRTAAVDIGTRDDKSAKFRAGITVIAIKKIGADFHVQILDDIPDRPGLSD